MIEFNFSERAVVVTGGASGIGRACARIFHECGAEVHVVDLAEPEPAVPWQYHQVDISDDEAVDRLIGDLANGGSTVRHLVNSAVNFAAAGASATRGQWRGSLGVNVESSAMLTARLARLMPPGSTVVNVSSISAHVAQADRWTYNASKAAILALTRCQALDYRGAGIRVNSVSPGWVWTPEVAKAAGGDRAAWEPIWGDYHILGRLGEPDEIADAVAYLSSDRSSFVNGTELMVDGGYSALGPEGLGATASFAGTDLSQPAPNTSDK